VDSARGFIFLQKVVSKQNAMLMWRKSVAHKHYAPGKHRSLLIIFPNSRAFFRLQSPSHWPTISVERSNELFSYRTFRGILCSGSNTPVSVVNPSTLLTFLAAVLRPAASAALCKLSGKLLPLPALIVSTLPDASSAFIFAAEIPHDNTCPVLHVLAVVLYSKFLH